MARYIVGDIHGCYQTLLRLLEQVDFKPSQDELWATGDLVGRGPKPLATLKYLYQLGASFQTTLGNHDLHCLALYHNQSLAKNDFGLQTLLQAAEAPTLMKWLQQQPMTLYHPAKNIFISHAGIPPCWKPFQAHQYGKEVEQQLQSPQIANFLLTMYGNEPTQWDSSLTGVSRYRFIINALTRMRFCTPTGTLELLEKRPPEQVQTSQLRPWFTFQDFHPIRVFFGHWASLCGVTHQNDTIGLDTGCVWGGSLTLYDCETHEKISQSNLDDI